MTQTTQQNRPLPVPEVSFWDRIKYKVHALILIALIVSAAIIAGAAYNKEFTTSIPVTVQADRAGLQMHKNNRVKIRGVDLGRVDSVELNAAQTGVNITLALDPKLAKRVPSNATVSLEQLTAFGNKSIQLNDPAIPSGQFLHAGSVITADHVSTEINSTFDHLMTLVTELRPSKLNATLGAVAQTVQGKGDSLGVTITKANDYLKKLNTNLPNLQRDFRVTGGFAQVYADAAPDIVDTLANAGVTARTFGDKRDDFQSLLHSLHGAGNELDDFFAENADPLTDMLRSLRPTTSLLQEYSPALTCFLDGAAITYDGFNSKLFDENGAQFELHVVEGTEPYQYPADLPEVGPGPQKGPNCRGLPVVSRDEYSLSDYTTGPAKYQQMTTDNSPKLSKEPAVVQFFGPGILGTPSPLRGGH
jgi:phospholipid/cholesterol/gamma-HCH transport system substrate-binding protein